MIVMRQNTERIRTERIGSEENNEIEKTKLG